MKTNLDSLFKTDKKLQEEGVEFVINEKISFRVRHLSQANPRVKAAMAQHFKPYAQQVSMGTLPPEKEAEINQKVFIDVCLVSWEGIEIDGATAECNKENATKLFRDLPDLFEALWKHANDFTHYRIEVGNS
jgi:hypothetical protein